MKFKTQENNLIWENYQTPDMGYEDAENAVIALDPVGELEVDEGDGFDMDDQFGMDDHDECNCSEQHEVDEVLYSDAKKLAEYSKRILEHIKSKELEPWMKAKIIKASDYMSDVWHRLDASVDFANDQDPDLEL